MPTMILGVIVILFEILCFFFGASLFNTDAPKLAWQIWGASLVSIPVTGFGAAWVYSRKRAKKQYDLKTVGLSAAILGCAALSIWLALAVKAKQNGSQGAVIASLSIFCSLYLVTAGLHLIRQAKSIVAHRE